MVTIDKSRANTAALASLNVDKVPNDTMTIRQQKYLNNLVKQAHRNIKLRIPPMFGFKSFRHAQTLRAGIEVVQRIRKGQYQHPEGNCLSPTEQFIWWLSKNRNRNFFELYPYCNSPLHTPPKTE